MIVVRQEREKEYLETEAALREAFWDQYAPGASEHYLAHCLRGHPGFVPELALVAAEKERILGAVMCLRTPLLCDDGVPREVLTVGPLGVIPSRQRRGVGARLLAEVKARGRRLGFPALFLTGDPAYYARQGFVPAERYDVRDGEDFYFGGLLACELEPGALSGAAGRWLMDPVYEVNEEAARAYDRRFPPKEARAGTAAQRRFERLLGELTARRRPHRL